jgi:hypothetical protein
METNQKAATIDMKGRLKRIWDESQVSAHLAKNALRSFLVLNEVPIVWENIKIEVKRSRKKVELSWKQGLEIISFTDQPYRSIFMMMLRSGLGLDEFMEIQRSPEIIKSIDSQRGKPTITIDLEPRKKNSDRFYVIVQSEHVPPLPIYTRQYKNRDHRSLVDIGDLQNIWHRAALKAGLWIEGLGAHYLRSVFKSTAMKAGVKEAISEFCLGHGSDRLGYSRPDEELMVSELTKLWNFSNGGSGEAIAALRQDLDGMKANLSKVGIVVDGDQISISKLLENLEKGGAIKIPPLKSRMFGKTYRREKKRTKKRP